MQPVLFAIFLLTYLGMVRGNVSILAGIFLEPRLHTPMYFFLVNLSLLDIGCITFAVPSVLACLLACQCRVPFASCISQLFFFHLLANVDLSHLSTAMAYNHYLAICQPLIYSTHMRHEVQDALVGICCTISFTNALTHTVPMSTLNFCGPNIGNHYYCDFPSLFQLCCSSTHLNGQLLFVGATFMGVIPMILISVSYAHITAAVLLIHLAEGRKKAFSTCASHLPVVCIFYGTGFFSYMHLGSVSASDKDKGIGILSTILSPILNSPIYSLQNPDVQGTLKRVLMGKRLLE